MISPSLNSSQPQVPLEFTPIYAHAITSNTTMSRVVYFLDSSQHFIFYFLPPNYEELPETQPIRPLTCRCNHSVFAFNIFFPSSLFEFSLLYSVQLYHEPNQFVLLHISEAPLGCISDDDTVKFSLCFQGRFLL